MRFLARWFLLVALLVAALTSASGRQPQPGLHPIVYASDGYLLGGADSGKWLDADATVAQVKGEERYRVYSLTRCLGTSVGGIVHVEDPGETPYVDLTPSRTGSTEVLAICGTWNALPRTPRVQSTKQKVYQDAVRAALKKGGLSGATVNVTQVIRVDLEGDGQQEVLISAATPGQKYLKPSSDKNDYSIVLLRKIVNGKVKTLVVESEFYPKPVTFNAPNTFKIAAILDFDGDGVMEIAVSWRYYEGNGIDIYSSRAGKLVRVISGGSGA